MLNLVNAIDVYELLTKERSLCYILWSVLKLKTPYKKCVCLQNVYNNNNIFYTNVSQTFPLTAS